MVPPEDRRIRWLVAGPAPGRSRPPLLPLAVLAFSAAALLLKQTVPIGLVGVPVSPRLPVVAAGLVFFELAPAVAVLGRSMVLRILAVDAFVSLITEGDLVSFRINRRFLSVLSLPLVTYVSRLGSAISSAIHPADALLLIDLAALAAIAALLPAGKLPARASQSKLMAGIGLATVALAMGSDPYWRHATLRNPATAGHASLLPFHVLGASDAALTALRARYFRREEVSALQRWYAERRPRDRAGGPLLPRAARFENLIVVQFESLQAWALGMRLGDQEVTPTLNRLRASGLSFENAYSQVGSGNTADAEWLALCSLYPAAAGVAFVRYTSADLDCLPSLLRSSGFETLAFHGNDLSVYDREEMYVTAGFSLRYGRRNLHADIARYEIPDRSLYAQIPPLIPRDRPFAVHVVSVSSHRPFLVPPQGLQLGKLEGTIAGHYLESIHYADAALGEFLRALEAQHLLARTLLVVYGDHGGINREDGGTTDLPAALPADEAAWLVFERRVPLLFVGRGLPAMKVTTPAGQIDITPTIAGLLRVPTEHAGLLGRDLLNSEPRPVVFWSGNVLDSDHVYLEGRSREPSCFTARGARVPGSACDALAAFGERERKQAQIMLDADLVTSVNH
jgi:phosphoglycerol transferase MdoB-like AlkP superfamily enzyme